MHQKWCGTADDLRSRRNEKERVQLFQGGFDDVRCDSESPEQATEEKREEELDAQ
jgi:hypothetical protein